MLKLHPNRGSRRSDRRRTARKLLATASAAVATTALTAGVSAPAANAAVYNPDVALAADVIDIPTITAGPLLGLAELFGISTLPISLGPLGNYNLNLTWSQSNPANVYNAINGASPMKPYETWGAFCGALTSSDGSCRATPAISAGFGAFGAIEAINNLGLSAAGTTLWPLADIVGDGLTNSPLIALINPLRPNGGIGARFAPLLDLLGVDTSLASSGVQPNVPWTPTSEDSPWETTSFISNLIDVTWEYNLLSDFPVSLNPFSLLNSALAAIPPVGQLTSSTVTELLGEVTFTFVSAGGEGLPPAGAQVTCAVGSDDCYAGLSSQDLLGFVLAPTLAGGNAPQIFITLPAEDLPLLAPLRLPAQLINGALDALAAAFAPPGSAGLPFRLGTPIADILQPALKILVNIGYSDVITPTDIANNPDLITQGFCGLGGVCYDRAFSQTGTLTPFGSVSTLTPQEWLQVPGDVLGALVTGITQQLAKPFFGILEPAPCVACTPTAAVAPRVAATVPAPSAAVAAEPVADATPVADAAPAAVTAAVSEPAAEAPASESVAVAPSAVSESRTAARGAPRAARASAATPARGVSANAGSSRDDDGGSPGRTRSGRAGR